MTSKKKFTLAIGTLLAVFPLTSCDMSEDFATVSEGLLPNLWITLTQMAIFVVTALVVIFFAYKPIKKKLKQRQDYIEKNINDAKLEMSKVDEEKKKAEEIIADAQKQAGEIIQEAQKNAEINAQAVQKELALSIETQKEQAHKDIEAERERMLNENHNKMVDTAIEASKQILSREINEEDNKKMVDEFINHLMDEGD